MPSGPVHNAATLTVAVTSTVILIYQTRGDLNVALACAGGALVALAINPDRDLAESQTEGGLLLSHPMTWLWNMAWWPYAKIARHRSAASHAPIISTLGRLAYVALWLAPLWVCNGWEFPRLQAWMLWGLFGLILSDAIHALLDKLDELFGGRL